MIELNWMNYSMQFRELKSFVEIEKFGFVHILFMHNLNSNSCLRLSFVRSHLSNVVPVVEKLIIIYFKRCRRIASVEN